MANTERLKREVEDFVRSELERQYGRIFEKARLILDRAVPPEGDHEFDAVSPDRKIVAGIISSRAQTKGQKRNVSAVHHATGELLYLSLVSATVRILVCTERSFFDLMVGSVMKGRMPVGVELIHVPLPAPLQSRVEVVRSAASLESRRTDV